MKSITRKSKMLTPITITITIRPSIISKDADDEMERIRESNADTHYTRAHTHTHTHTHTALAGPKQAQRRVAPTLWPVRDRADAVRRKEWLTSLRPSAPIIDTMDHRTLPPTPAPDAPPYSRTIPPASHPPSFSLSPSRGDISFVDESGSDRRRSI